MNRKVYYRLWRYVGNLHHGNREVKGYAEMLSLKRLWRRQGYQVEIEKYDKKGDVWNIIETKR